MPKKKNVKLPLGNINNYNYSEIESFLAIFSLIH